MQEIKFFCEEPHDPPAMSHVNQVQKHMAVAWFACAPTMPSRKTTDQELGLNRMSKLIFC